MRLTSSNKITLMLLGVSLIAFLPRLLIALNSTQIPLEDAAGYDSLAINIFEGKGFVTPEGEATSWREPFYPFFLSSIYYFFGHSYKAVRIVQAIMGTLTGVFVFLIALRIFGKKVAFLGALIAGLNPAFIKIGEYLLTENLFTFLLILATFFLVKQAQEPDIKNLVFLGVFLGLTTLTRSITLLFPLFILLFMGKTLVSPAASKKKYLLGVIIFISSFILILLPWTIRNWHVHHRLIPITSRSGLGFYTSFVPKDGKVFGFNANDEITKRSEAITSEVERSDYMVRETIKYIKKHPEKLLRLEILKMLFFWCPFYWEIIGEGVFNFMYGFILPFFILAIFITLSRFRQILPIYLPIINSLFASLLTYGMPRFRLPIEPYVIILASFGINYFFLKSRKKIYPTLLTVSFFLLNLSFYFNSFQVKVVARTILEKFYLW